MSYRLRLDNNILKSKIDKITNFLNLNESKVQRDVEEPIIKKSKSKTKISRKTSNNFNKKLISQSRKWTCFET